MPLPACRPTSLRAACLVLACLVIASPAPASSSRTPARNRPSADKLPSSPYAAFEGPVSRLERELFRDAADGRLQQHTPLAAALVASGVSDEREIRRLEDRLAAWIAELEDTQDAESADGEPLQQAAAAFEFMHRRMLTGGYSRDSTDLRQTLASGRFNCASASLLYCCLADHFGLEARGLELPGHAMVRLVLPDRTLDVETTCPRWFHLLDDPEAAAELPARANGVRPREVTPIQMAAMIYYNRGIDLLAASRFAEAAGANAKALRLDPASATARGNLLATLNNWAIRLGESAAYAEAAERLEAGLALDPHYPAFAANYAHVHHEWAHSLCQAKRFSEAADVLARAASHRPADDYFPRAIADVHRRWAAWLFDTGKTDEAFQVLAAAEARFGRRPELAAAATAAVNDYAVRLIQQGRYERAVLLIDRALDRFPDAQPLRDNRRVAVMRWAEPAFLEGDYAEAIRRTISGSQAGRLHESLVNNVRYGYQQWIAQLQAAGRPNEVQRITAQAETDPFLGY